MVQLLFRLQLLGTGEYLLSFTFSSKFYSNGSRKGADRISPQSKSTQIIPKGEGSEIIGSDPLPRDK